MPKIKLTQSFINRTNKPSSGQSHTTYYDTYLSGLGFKITAKASKSFLLRYTQPNGKVTERRIGDPQLHNLSDIRNEAQQMLADLSRGRDPFAEHDASKDCPTVNDFVMSTYLPYAKAHKKSWETEWSLLKTQILPSIGERKMGHVTTSELVELITTYRQARQPSSANRMLALVHRIFNQAIEWKVSGMGANPADPIDSFNIEPHKARYLSDDELRRLMESLDQSTSVHLKSLVLFLLATGARRGEALKARWSEIDFDKQEWYLPDTKSGKPHWIPLNEAALGVLDQIPRVSGSDHVFADPKTGEPHKHLFSSFDRARKRAGLPHVRIHDLRHTFASRLVNSGRSLVEVQKLLNHQDYSTTLRYAHLQSNTLQEATTIAAQSMGSVFNGVAGHLADS